MQRFPEVDAPWIWKGYSIEAFHPVPRITKLAISSPGFTEVVKGNNPQRDLLEHRRFMAANPEFDKKVA